MTVGAPRRVIEPSDERGANYQWMITAIVPRPIAWISTRGADGSTNLAPFSYFNGVSSRPPVVMISISRGKRSGEQKDTLTNILARREFVVNVVTEDLGDPMVLSSVEFAYGASEIEAAGLHTFPAQRIDVPCIVESPVNLECRLHQTLEIGGNVLVFGEVVLLHAREDVLDERGLIDPDRLRPLGRLGGAKYERYGGSIEKRPPRKA